MKTSLGNRPGAALQRGTGAVMKNREGTQNPTSISYTNPLDHQRRHLQNRHGLSKHAALLIVELHFKVMP
ncbi:hypothetical protein [Aestuariivita boseongensis]|uniref:hypothetical protein n=1 Tax=Aestuariivita boseongensis TaxID=1470562 RepID=UPI00067FFBEC|nr:hypothetical protein [Aestuariivita boseongensis]